MLLLALLFTNPRANAEAPAITLSDAVEHARQTPGVAAAQSAEQAAAAGYAQAWPGRLPSLSVSGNVLVYNKAQELTLFTSDTPIDCTGIPDPFGTLCASFGQPIIVREQVTTSLQAQLAVPITGQFAVDRQVAAAKDGMNAAQSSREASVADAELEAKDAWFAAAQTEEQLAIASSQVASMTERVHVAETAFSAGSLTRNDLLLVRIALAQAKEAVAQLAGYRDLAYARLGVATGTGGDPVRPQGATEDPPKPVPDVAALTERALKNRPEILAMRDRVAAARAAAAATSLARIPSISGMAVYQHSTGQGAFGSPDTAYAGASLNWNVWAFGRAAAGVTAAKAQADQLAHTLDGLEAGVRMDVLARVQALTVASSTWTLAADTVTQATENLAIQERRQQTGTGTMQEVLDANLALVRAQSTRASALFDARRAEAGLTHAVGGDPWG